MVMSGKCMAHKAAWVLVVVGALNWGLVGAFQWNLVNVLLGSMPMVERVVYILVGLAGIVVAVGCRCKKCMASCGTDKKMDGGMGMGGMEKKM